MHDVKPLGVEGAEIALSVHEGMTMETHEFGDVLAPSKADGLLAQPGYKFQRLRERIRSAIETGEFVGKLPGERVLAERFKVNAKTLSKALTDLAAEGLVDRNIGQGTFVRNAEAPRESHKLLFLCDNAVARRALVAMISEGDIDTQICDAPTKLRPSLLHPFRSVVVCTTRVSDEALRDLVVRGKSVVLLDRVSTHYATHAVLQNYAVAAASLARRLVDMGHRTIGVIDSGVLPDVVNFVRTVVGTDALGDGVKIVSGMLDDVQSLVEVRTQARPTAFVCTSCETARYTASLCRASGLTVPEDISVVAVGRLTESPRFTGQYIDDVQIAEAITRVLRDASPHKPVSVWLVGEYVDVGTAVRHA